mmetsp:Transcript_6424/g.24928  ORF Transcript_6424/g.24928 Transcript_6424/m.24928 type:complete len:102 (-) Transcript_6424:410-715(-)
MAAGEGRRRCRTSRSVERYSSARQNEVRGMAAGEGRLDCEGPMLRTDRGRRFVPANLDPAVRDRWTERNRLMCYTSHCTDESTDRVSSGASCNVALLKEPA